MDPQSAITLRTSKFQTNRLLQRKQMVVDVLHPARPKSVFNSVQAGQKIAAGWLQFWPAGLPQDLSEPSKADLLFSKNSTASPRMSSGTSLAPCTRPPRTRSSPSASAHTSVVAAPPASPSFTTPRRLSSSSPSTDWSASAWPPSLSELPASSEKSARTAQRVRLWPARFLSQADWFYLSFLRLQSTEVPPRSRQLVSGCRICAHLAHPNATTMLTCYAFPLHSRRQEEEISDSTPSFLVSCRIFFFTYFVFGCLPHTHTTPTSHPISNLVAPPQAFVFFTSPIDFTSTQEEERMRYGWNEQRSLACRDTQSRNCSMNQSQKLCAGVQSQSSPVFLSSASFSFALDISLSLHLKVQHPAGTNPTPHHPDGQRLSPHALLSESLLAMSRSVYF